MNTLEQIVTEECQILQNVVSISAYKLEKQYKTVDINLSERIEKIKTSFERIDKLMKKLRGDLK